MSVNFYLLFDLIVFDVLKSKSHHMPHVIDHVLDIVSGLWTFRVDQDLLNAGVILRVDLVFGCSQFGLDVDHTAFLFDCKDNLLGTH
jgi:hypothetical protein